MDLMMEFVTLFEIYPMAASVNSDRRARSSNSVRALFFAFIDLCKICC